MSSRFIIEEEPVYEGNAQEFVNVLKCDLKDKHEYLWAIVQKVRDIETDWRDMYIHIYYIQIEMWLEGYQSKVDYKVPVQIVLGLPPRSSANAIYLL